MKSNCRRINLCRAELSRRLRGAREKPFQVASVFGLRDRGLLRSGLAADIAVFDPKTVNTLAPEYVQDLPGNERRMIQRATGVHHTLVNGEVVIENGAVTGVYPGQVLRELSSAR
jgi:N-acyl-D-amino-acid deacylase